MDKIKSSGGNISNLIRQYKYLILILIFSLIIFVSSYYLSEKYRVNKCLDRLKLYQKHIRIDSKLKLNNLKRFTLSNFYIASSYKSCCGVNEKFDYLSLDILEQIIKSGARAFWFDIYNETFDSKTKPIVTNGYENGQWKLNLNYLYLEDCLKMVSNTAFSSGSVDNYEDPIFLALNLNVDRNLKTLEDITNLIYKYFSKKILDSNYSKNKKNMGTVPMNELMGKVIIMASSGYEDSPLEELVNMTWDTDNFRKIDERSLDPEVKDSEFIKLDTSELKDFNSNNISLVFKDNYYFSYNYDPIYALNSGCQFVFMNYQNVDENMDKYVTKFVNSSFELKPSNMINKLLIDNQTSLNQNKRKKEKKDEKNAPKCPEKPNENVELVDTDALSIDRPIYFKNDSEKTGVCALSTNCPIKYDINNRKMWHSKKSGISFVVSKNDKNIGFKYGCINDKAGNTPDGDQVLNMYPKLCCSGTKENDLKNLYTLSPQCHNPDSYVANIGMKVHNKYSSKVPFSIGNKDGDYTWAYPKMCKINNLDEVKDGKNCLVSTKKCPEDWNNNNSDILLENNWKLCCRNLE